jgi:hypothetical protein
MIDVGEPCDSNPFKPLNKSTITIIYKTLELTKNKVVSVESQNLNLVDYKTPK